MDLLKENSKADQGVFVHTRGLHASNIFVPTSNIKDNSYQHLILSFGHGVEVSYFFLNC